MQKKIIICGLADIQECVDKYEPDKMLTIINKNFSPDTPQGMDKNRHLILHAVYIYTMQAM